MYVHIHMSTYDYISTEKINLIIWTLPDEEANKRRWDGGRDKKEKSSKITLKIEKKNVSIEKFLKRHLYKNCKISNSVGSGEAL